MDKHPNLLLKLVNYGYKLFYNIAPRLEFNVVAYITNDNSNKKVL
jgi:hypothetical protein